jgi:hypothetical protein
MAEGFVEIVKMAGLFGMFDREGREKHERKEWRVRAQGNFFIVNQCERV